MRSDRSLRSLLSGRERIKGIHFLESCGKTKCEAAETIENRWFLSESNKKMLRQIYKICIEIFIF